MAAEFFEAARETVAQQKVRLGIGWGLWDMVQQVRVESAAHLQGITIEACDAFCADQYNEQLRGGSLDVVFARGEFDATALTVEPLVNERLVAMLSADSPLASRQSLHIRDLAHEPLLLWDRHAMPALYDKILELYSSARVSPRTIPTPGAGPWNHNGLMLIASGKGVYVGLGVRLTSPQPASGVAVVPIDDANATVEVSVAWRKAETSRTILRFLDSVWQAFPRDRRSIPMVESSSRRAS